MTKADNLAFDLGAYLRRIGFTGACSPTLQTLAGLHRAHATHIPFENLDLQLGCPIVLDLESLQAKLVRATRGGYCFEQNTLFAAALEQIGFPVTRLAARVRLGATRVTPRTHMLLRVEAGGQSWVADVGFGGGGLLEPIPLKSGPPAKQDAWTFRLTREAEAWILQALGSGTWQDLYAFTLEPQFPADFEVANHYTATHPSSPFVQTLTVQLPGPEAYTILRNRELTIERDGAVDRRTIDDDEALLQVLAKTFGLHFAPGTRFRCLIQR
jgi:N-hydroxyarylamine O-acetyltransferase